MTTTQLEEITGVCPAVVAGERLWLHPFRAAYWESERTLLIADLHLGKALHFRREGIPVPSSVSHENWDRLIGLLLDFKPHRVLLLGDLFHSDYNQEWEDFRQMVDQFSAVEFELILGNHDALPNELYQQANLKLRPEPFEQGPFLFSHHPMEELPEGKYNIAGHIHPCVFLQGNGRLRERLPCFYFGKDKGILPAFGAFTGMAKVTPKKADQVYVIAGEVVVGV
jgi:DNA ligase-associated metallophosphoesterase